MGEENNSQDFLRRAVAEAERYGDDPWVLLRELGQNSRDAQARRIEVKTREGDGRQTLTFSDDGRGMSLEHARTYLFRLYASSKGSDTNSAGRFGVGFWSVLRFGPQRIEIHSRCRGEAWGVALRGDLNAWHRVDCRRSQPGTTVVLEREAPDRKQADSFLDQVAAGLDRYLAHLRSAGLKAQPLPVSLNGKSMARPFSLPGPGTMHFQDGPIEGVVGFGPRPAYRLYARGLPVAAGAYLEELEGRPGQQGAETERDGVAPVFLINGNNLDVVLSRQTVVRNRALMELVRVARQRFDQLVSETIEGSVPRSIWHRLGVGLRRIGRRFQGPRWLRWSTAVIGLVLLGGLVGVSLSWWSNGGRDPTGLSDGLRVGARQDAPAAGAPGVPASPDPDPDPTPRPARAPALRPGEILRAPTGTVTVAGGESSWSFSYQPPLPIEFRSDLLDRYDRQRGWFASGSFGPPRRPRRLDPADERLIRVALDDLPGAGLFNIPVPTGYGVVAGSASMGGRAVAVLVDDSGLARVELGDPASGPLRYAVAPGFLPARGGRQAMASRVDTALPAELAQRLFALRGKAPQEQVDGVVRLVHALLAYDRSRQTAMAYRRQVDLGSEPWLQRVLALGVGDCDVINGVLVVLLREIGIPARLAVGIVGRDGRGLPGWHAWAEVALDGSLVVVDASLGARRLAGTDAGPGLAAGAGNTDPAPAMAWAASGDQEPQTSQRQAVLGWLLAGLIGLSGLLLVFLFVAHLRHKESLRISGDSQKRRKLLAGMALDALRRPRAWRHVGGIWNQPMLPCLGRRHVSLAQLIRLCRAGQAFLATPSAALVPEAMASRAVVLDALDADFGPLYAQTSQLRDLDELDRFLPRPDGGGMSGALTTALEDLLCRVGADTACRIVAGEAAGRLCWDVDLAPIRPGRRSAWPVRFIAINPQHSFWRQLAALFQRAPAVSLAAAIDRLAGESSLVAEKAEALRREAARAALAGGS